MNEENERMRLIWLQWVCGCSRRGGAGIEVAGIWDAGHHVVGRERRGAGHQAAINQGCVAAGHEVNGGGAARHEPFCRGGANRGTKSRDFQ